MSIPLQRNYRPSQKKSRQAPDFKFEKEGVRLGSLGEKLLETGRKDVQTSFFRLKKREQDNRIHEVQREIREFEELLKEAQSQGDSRAIDSHNASLSRLHNLLTQYRHGRLES